MKYGPRITYQIGEELIKTPNIRYVCKKMGIDHSTFYRWMSHHHTFSKLVTGYIEIGRDRMSESAEGVIIGGIQNGDFKCATYWLSHNSPRYSSSEQEEYLGSVSKKISKMLDEETPENSSESLFEHYFDIYECMQAVFGLKKAKEKIDIFVKMICHGKPDLEDIFYASYTEWKNNKDEANKKREDILSRDPD